MLLSRLRHFRFGLPIIYAVLLCLLGQVLRLVIWLKFASQTPMTGGEAVRVLLTGLHVDVVTALAVTTRGMKEAEMGLIADFIHEALTHREDVARLHAIRERVVALNRGFPLP